MLHMKLDKLWNSAQEAAVNIVPAELQGSIKFENHIVVAPGHQHVTEARQKMQFILFCYDGEGTIETGVETKRIVGGDRFVLPPDLGYSAQANGYAWLKYLEIGFASQTDAKS